MQIIGVPLTTEREDGGGMGQSAIRIAGLHEALEKLDWQVRDGGDLPIPAPETLSSGQSNARFLPLIAKTCTDLCKQVEQTIGEGAFPLVLGGDHSIAIGTISALANHLRKDESQAAPNSVLCGSMRMATSTRPKHHRAETSTACPWLCTLGDGPEPLTRIGYDGPKLRPELFAKSVRDIDKVEKLLRNSGVHCYDGRHRPPLDVRRHGRSHR